MSVKLGTSNKIIDKRHISLILVFTLILLSGCVEETPTKDTSKPFLLSEYDVQNAIYSPDGEYIVFSSKMDEGNYFDIWMMTYDGKDLEQITFEDYDQKEPSMSHDNKKIVFSAYDELRRSWNLWEYSLEEKSSTQLTNDIFNQSFPTYSNNDLKIIYSSNEGLPKYDPLDGMQILRRIWTLDLNTKSRELLYDSDENCYHPDLLKNTDKVIFIYYYDPVIDFFDPSHLQIYISNINGSIWKAIDINDCNIYYSSSIDENNVIFSIYYKESFGVNYGQCVGHYNLITNNFTIILADCNYSIDQLSYSSIENKIMINCRDNNSIFIRKFDYQPENYNGNKIADNVEDFPDRDPTAPLSAHNEPNKDSKDSKKESEDGDIQLCLIGDMVFIQIIIVMAIVILVLLIIIIFFIKKNIEKKKKKDPKPIKVKFIEEK